jgi:REP element-mobilizing transposase RayT
MTNHVHLIARAAKGNNLSDILPDFKKFTSKTVLKAIAENDRDSRKNWLLTFQNRERQPVLACRQQAN